MGSRSGRDRTYNMEDLRTTGDQITEPGSPIGTAAVATAPASDNTLNDTISVFEDLCSKKRGMAFRNKLRDRVTPKFKLLSSKLMAL